MTPWPEGTTENILNKHSTKKKKGKKRQFSRSELKSFKERNARLRTCGEKMLDGVGVLQQPHQVHPGLQAV